MSINSWTKKIVYACNGILLSNNKEQTTDTYNVDKFLYNCTERNNPPQIMHVVLFHLYRILEITNYSDIQKLSNYTFRICAIHLMSIIP